VGKSTLAINLGHALAMGGVSVLVVDCDLQANVTQLALDCYFAAVLGVSGLAKIDNPALFAVTLRRQRLLPRWSITSVSYIFPWVELILAGALIIGVLPALTAALVLVLFSTFFVIETIILISRRETNCSCYGGAYTYKVDKASARTSVVFMALAALNVWASSTTAPIAWLWRLSATILFSIAGVWLLQHVMRRRNPSQFKAMNG